MVIFLKRSLSNTTFEIRKFKHAAIFSVSVQSDLCRKPQLQVFSQRGSYTITTLTVLHCLGTDIGGTDQTAGMHSGIEKQICYLSFEQCNIFFYLLSESG